VATGAIAGRKMCRFSAIEKENNKKNTVLDFTAAIHGTNIRFMAPQPGSAMKSWGPAIFAFAHRSCLPSRDFSR